MAQELSPARARELIPAQALARVPGAVGASSVRIALLEGGTLNRSFRIDTDAGQYALRLSPGADAWLAVDRAVERELHARASAVGIAPRIVHADEHDRWLITELVVGRSWSGDDFADPECLARLGETLRRLHALPVPASCGRFDLLGTLDAYARRIDAPDRALDRYRDEAALSWSVVAAAARPAAILHHDLHASNLIESSAGLVLIDWECAAVSDPLLDVACILSYYETARAHAGLLLERCGLAGVTSCELAAAVWLFDLHVFLWYRERRQRLSPTDAELDAEHRLSVRLACGAHSAL